MNNISKNDPKIFLAADNCFGYKRWVLPDEWGKVLKELGINFVEASADNELDPFYMGKQYLTDWVKDVKSAEKLYGIKVSDIYSGHGSYTTLGLAHPDKRVRERIKKEWFMRLIDIAAELEAGFGFFAHGFSQSMLQNSRVYEQYKEILLDNFCELAEYAEKVGCKNIGVEQMYSPHQIPWRIDETHEMMRELKKRGHDFYFTEDLGHHHMKFIKPKRTDIVEAVLKKQKKGLWLGTENAYQLYELALRWDGNTDSVVNKLLEDIDEHGYLFAEARDGDCYQWLEEIGEYAPIVHLQQTNGTESAHKFFTEENNSNGKIKPKKLINALKKAYQKPVEKDMPARCEEIHLTFEAFLSTAAIPHDALLDYKETVKYWRNFIPIDGMRLSELK
ncbi:MAG: TIM barrel protein [Christensenella sp.]